MRIGEVRSSGWRPFSHLYSVCSCCFYLKQLAWKCESCWHVRSGSTACFRCHRTCYTYIQTGPCSDSFALILVVWTGVGGLQRSNSSLRDEYAKQSNLFYFLRIGKMEVKVKYKSLCWHLKVLPSMKLLDFDFGVFYSTLTSHFIGLSLPDGEPRADPRSHSLLMCWLSVPGVDLIASLLPSYVRQ